MERRRGREVNGGKQNHGELENRGKANIRPGRLLNWNLNGAETARWSEARRLCFIYLPVEGLQSRRLTLYSFQINYSLFPLPAPTALFGCPSSNLHVCHSRTPA